MPSAGAARIDADARAPSSPASAVGSGRGPAAWIGLVIVVLGSVAWAYLATKDLFVFSEARGYAFEPPMAGRPLVDVLVRFLLQPEIDWGNARLTGRYTHLFTGAVCDASVPCVNAVTAALTGLTVAAVYVHTLQLLRRASSSVLVVALWVLSPAMLGIWLWQSTRFDLMAVLGLVLTGTFWWWGFARPRLGPLAAIGFVVASIALLAFSFNAKEIDWVLLPAMPVLAVLRGIDLPGGVRRNLLLCVLPLAWGAWFVTHALTHVYGAAPAGPVLQGTLDLLRLGLGLAGNYMYVPQSGDLLERLQGVAMLGFGAFLALLIGMVVAAAVAAWRARSAVGGRPGVRDLVRAYGLEAYLALIGGVTLLVGGRALYDSSAYYLLLPSWAILVLGTLVIRRSAARLPHGRALARAAGALFVGASLVASVSLYTPGTTYRQLVDASAGMRSLGAELRRLLDGRPVGAVWWLTEGPSPTAFFTLRDHHLARLQNGVYPSGSELWPFLVGGRATVTAIPDGTAETLRTDLGGHVDPGDVVIAISPDLRLRLLAADGTILLDATRGR